MNTAECRRPIRRVLVACAWLTVLAAPAHAWPVAGTAGIEYASAGSDAATRSALLAGVTRFGGLEATLAVLRFDDQRVGTGSGVSAGLGLPLVPSLSLQLQGSRFLADGGYRSWRTRLGPRFELPRGANALIAWQHQDDDTGLRTDAAVLESAVPLVAGLAFRLDGSAGTLPDSRWSEAGAAGLSWTGLSHLQLLAEGGVARNAGSFFTESAPQPLLPILPRGQDRSGTTPDVVSPTLLLGLRITLP